MLHRYVISFFSCNLLTLPLLLAQASFPEDFLGIYKGQLEISNPGNPSMMIPMEFHLLGTDSSDRYDYRLIYDGQPRNYTLVVDDLETGTFRIDEKNGIILPAKLSGNTLYSFFQVQENFLSSRLAFSENQLEFEILFSNTADKARTGENTEYEIYGFPISTTQRAVLIKN